MHSRQAALGARARNMVVALVTLALAASTLVVISPAASAAPGTVTGVAYRDFNGNGVRDTGDPTLGVQTDVGIGAITVTAYDARGAIVDTVGTNADGTYTLDTSTVADGTPLRVEFTNFPLGFAPSFLGTNNGSAIQLVEAGDENVDLMVNHPDDYAQANAPAYTVIQSAGRASGTSANEPSVVGIPWSAPNNNAPTYPDRDVLADFEDTGSVWGATYDRHSNSLFAAAAYKRHSGLGPLGLGGIYRITNVLDSSGNMSGASTVSNWLDVSGFINVGTAQTDAARGFGATLTPTTDVDAFANAARVGIGGVAVSSDGNYLLLINLADRDLYVLDIAGGVTPTSATRVDLSALLTADQVPWALTIHHGQVYVGYVDTGSAPGVAASTAGLNAYVIAAPVADVVSNSATWTNVFTADLGYRKGNVASGWGGGGTAPNWPTTRPQVVRWNTWTDTWRWGGATSATATTSVGLNYSGGSWGSGNVHLYPQAILSDLAFDTDGYLTLAFLDRTALQGGNRNYPAIAGSTGPYFESLSSGDLLIASPAGDGTYTLENNGIVGTRTTVNPATNDEGPGGREFYDDAQDLGGASIHEDVALGSVATYPGVREIQASVYDPLDGIRLTGVGWFDTVDGSFDRGYEHTRDEGGGNNSTTFQKGGGLAGLAIALMAAPAEIGDRVWFDADQNGRQDADEPGIVGAPVELYLADATGAPTGAALASTTTDSSGNYVFSSSLWTSSTLDDPAEDLVVVFGTAAGATPVQFAWGAVTPNPDFTGLTWADLEFTAEGAAAASTISDSNADATTGEAPVTVLGSGMNDHSIDAGFVSSVDITVAKALDAASVAPPAGTEFEISLTVVDFRGDAVPGSPFTVDVAAGDNTAVTLPAFSTIASVTETGGAGYNAQYSPSFPADATDGLAVTVTNTIEDYAIGDYVWIDADRDGVQDAGEAPLAGVGVALLDGAGDPVLDGSSNPITTTTDAQGYYLFDNLYAGDYRIQFTLTPAQSADYLFTSTGAGTGSTDSDGVVSAGDPAVAETATITLDATNTNLVDDATYTQATITATAGIDPTWDAGVVRKSVSVGDYVWLDVDDDGLQGTDAGELPIQGVKLVLTGPGGGSVTDIAGNPVAPVWTAADGSYLFSGLPALAPGESYTVTIDQTDASTIGALDELRPVTAGVGADRAVDSSTWTADSGDLTADGDEDLTLDFGFVQRTYALGDYVWIDTNRNGVQDGGESPLDGVTVALLDAAGDPVLDASSNPITTTTDAQGFYLFDDLAPGSYRVEFTLTAAQQALYSFTTANVVAGGAGEDSDASLVTGRTGVIVLDDSNTELVSDAAYTQATINASEGIDPTWDAGVVRKQVSVGNYVWHDVDGDGLQGTDAGELAIQGVKLELTGPGGGSVTDVAGNPVAPQWTAADGTYLFTGLPALAAGESYTVTIDQTDASTIAALDELRPVMAGVGPDRAVDSSTWTEDSVDLTNDGDADVTLDFGFVSRTYALGDYVWIDADRDGVQDGGELPLAGVTVALLDAAGDPVLDGSSNPITTTTDAQGFYLFDDLAPGSYRVEFTLTVAQQALYTFTSADAAAGGAGGDSDAAATGRTGVIVLDDSNTELVSDAAYTQATINASEGIDPTWDAGVVLKAVSVGDYVWLDVDDDGLQGTDAGETPIANVKLVLTGPGGGSVTDVAGNPVGPQWTAADGSYLFSGLPALAAGESYTVTIDQTDALTIAALDELRPVTAGVGADRAVDSSTWTADSGDLTSNGDEDLTLDFGFVPRTYALGDYVWIDADRDGVQDGGELPLAGVTVALLDSAGDPVLDGSLNPITTTTDAQGFYLFDDLAPGNYRVEFTLTVAQQALYAFTTANVAAGGADADSDASASTGRTGVIVLDDSNTELVSDAEYTQATINASEGIDPTWDAGVVRKAVSVGDYVWLDIDDDGLQGTDAGELPIEDVKLVLTGPGGGSVTDVAGNPVGPVWTAADGSYLFSNLPALAAGESYTVTIDQTDALTIAALDELRPVTAGVGSDRAVDSSTWTADSGDLTADGDEDLTLDFGFVSRTYAVGDYVWIDADRDGVQDAGETPLAGVQVALLYATGDPVLDGASLPITTTTDAQGFYLFDNLLPGSYRVEFTLTVAQQALYTFTTANVVAGGATEDSDAAVATGLTFVFVLDGTNTELVSDAAYTQATINASEGIDPTWDAGVVRKSVSVGDYVWLDVDDDGLQGTDAGETPIEDVKLVLTGPGGGSVTDVFGNAVDPVWTDATGAYLFADLPALAAGDSYTVTIDQTDLLTILALDELRPVTAGVGADRAVDSSTWTEDSVDLTNDGDEDLTLDFGFVQRTYALGDYVWIDVDRDGVQDAGESPLAGVTVALLDAAGDPVLDVASNPITTTTDAQGFYLFDDLAPGNYRVEFTLTVAQQALYVFTTADAAAGGAGADSDAAATGRTGVIVLDDSNTELVSDAAYTQATITASEGIDPTWDAGVVRKSVSVGDYVWLDVDDDGLQGTGAGETPIEDVKLVLTGPGGGSVTDVFGNAVDPVWTDVNGFYEFTDLPALAAGESYTVTIDQTDASTIGALDELRPVTAGVGADRAVDSSTWTEDSGDLTDDGDEDLTLDFGFVQRTYALGDYVWIDADRDGVQDGGELPLEGVTVALLDGAGDPVLDGASLPITTTTDAQGFYLFDDLAPNTYRVEFTLTVAQQALYTFTAANVAAGGAGADSDATVATGQTGAIVLDDSNPELVSDAAYTQATITASEGIDPTWDAGVIRKSVSVGNYVWLDIDNDGIQGTDGGELPIEGVKLVLTAPGGGSVTDVFGQPVNPVWTDVNGFYEFTDLPALAAGESYTVTIDQTDADTIAALTELRPVIARAGGDRALDSSTWLADSIDLINDGDADITLDFGFVSRTYAVGDYVWIDTDRDGIQDAGELPLEDVTVALLDATGDPVLDGASLPITTTTDAQGFYLFDNLLPGSYRVEFTMTAAQQDLYVFTTADTAAGGVREDSDAAVATGLTFVFVLDGTNTELVSDAAYTQAVINASEGIDPTWDAGVVRKSVSVGNYVWVDVDNDGLQGTDAGELPIEGVKLVLTGPGGGSVTDVFGNAVDPVWTDVNGFYAFTDLPALAAGESYVVTIDQIDAATIAALTELRPVAAAMGLDRALDSSDWSELSIDLVNDGDADITLDFGFVPRTYALGDYVWIDADRDGVQDGGEVPLSGVTVELLAADDSVLATAITSDEGFYLFDNLPAGEYRVRFTLGTALEQYYAFTTAGLGTAEDGSDANVSTGLTQVISLDSSNTALTLTYATATVNASEGIDPTWDAGVVILPTPDGPPPFTEVELARTGTDADVWGPRALAVAAALMAAGIVLIVGRRRQQARS